MNIIQFKEFLLLLAVSTIALLSSSESMAQVSSAYVQSGEIVELSIDYWKDNRPRRIGNLKLRLGDLVKMKTWNEGRVKGELEAIAGDSLQVAGNWYNIYSIQRINGKFDYHGQGLVSIAIGTGVAVSSYLLAGVALDELASQGLLSLLIIGPFVIIYSGLLIISGSAWIIVGLADIVGARQIDLSKYSKSISLHTASEMIDNMSQRERKRYLKRLAKLNTAN